MRLNAISKVVTVIALLSFLIGCGSDNSLAPFQPQINNAANTFQLQATGVTNVSTVLTYSWQNDGTTGNVDQSTIVSKGTATVTILDANGTQVYTKNLADNGSFTTTAGVTGVWTIRVNLSNYSGTLNFRVQKP